MIQLMSENLQFSGCHSYFRETIEYKIDAKMSGQNDNMHMQFMRKKIFFAQDIDGG